MPKLGMEPIRRDQIRKAAAKLIAKRGFDGTTLNEVAKAARISTGAIHHYYENKLALLVDTLIYVSEWIQQAVRKKVELEPTGLGKLRALISVGIFEESRMARDGEGVWLWALSEAIRSKTLRKVINERRQLFQIILADVIRALDDPATMTEAEIGELAAEFDAYLCGLAFSRATGERKLEPEEVERSLLAMVTARAGCRSARRASPDMPEVLAAGTGELAGC